jgi:aspartyl-tRNA(Asn)/glutamyl-tRNA(Gln) amidotransferase subunit C
LVLFSCLAHLIIAFIRLTAAFTARQLFCLSAARLGSDCLFWSIPMALERCDVEKIAHLARIGLNEADIANTTATLNNILGLIDQMQAVDTNGIEPLAHPLETTQRLRPDVVSESNQREAYQAIAPAVEAGLFLVPKVIE